MPNSYYCWRCYGPLNTAGVCTKCGEPNIWGFAAFGRQLQ